MGASVVERITARIDAMPAGERRAAQSLLANYPVLGLKTAADFSQQAGVSSPTILRFIARLGFAHYADFQSALQDELQAQLQSPLSRSTRQADSSPLLDAMLDNVRDTVGRLSDREKGEMVAELCDPKARIALAGGRFTDPLARYMAAHLSLIRPGVTHMDGQESVWRDRLVDMGKRDVLVIFDIRRYHDGMLDFAGTAHQRGVRIHLYTDRWLSPIARFARHVVAARTEIPSPFDSSAALFITAETVIAEATRRLQDAGARRLAAIESLR